MPKQDFPKIRFSLLLLFSIFVVYGTIVPFNLGGIENVHQRIQDICWKPFMTNTGGSTSFSDVIQNILLFIPVGILGRLSLLNYRNSILNSIIILFYGASLSFSVECLQLFTTDRTPSITDLITNTFGTLLGILLSYVILRFWSRVKDRPIITKLIQYPLFVSHILLMFIILAELLQPFDFSLDFKPILSKAIHLYRHPFSTSFNGRDVPFVILLYSTFTFLTLKIIRYTEIKIPLWLSLSGLAFFNFISSSLQFVIISRYPDISAVLTGLIGILAGCLIFLVCKNRIINPAIILYSAYFLCLIFKLYYPFQISPLFQCFIWVPFFSKHSHTTMVSLENIIETGIIFSFGGYVLSKTIGLFSRKASILILILAIISIIEILQGWATGRHPYITDILIGFSAFLLGGYISDNGEHLFTESNFSDD